MANKHLRKVTELFIEGTELVFADDPPVIFWVQKLNSFQREAASQDGRAARARMVAALREVGSDEQAIFDASLDVADASAVRSAIHLAHAQEYLYSSVSEMRSDPAWLEKFEVMDTAADLADRPSDDPERVLIDRYNAEYIEEVDKRSAVKREQAEADMAGWGLPQLKDAYRDSYIDNKGMGIFQREFLRSQVYYGLRVCRAEKDANGSWRHAACQNHTELVFDDRLEVGGPETPEALLAQVVPAIERINMDRADARFSDGQGSSSESSPLPEPEAESTPSTPEVMSDELAGISS